MAGLCKGMRIFVSIFAAGCLMTLNAACSAGHPVSSSAVSSESSSQRSGMSETESMVPVSSETSSAPENSSSVSETASWKIPSDSSGLNKEQKAIYDNIKNHLIKIYENRSYYLAVKGGFIDLIVSDSDDGLYNFNLMYEGVAAFDSNKTLNVAAGGKTFSVPKAEGEQFYGTVTYADFKNAGTIELRYNDGNVQKAISLTQAVEPGLTQEQVILLMSVDPQAKTRYYFQDKKAGYFYCIYPTYDEKAANGEYGKKKAWVIELRNDDATNILYYRVSEDPLCITE